MTIPYAFVPGTLPPYHNVTVGRQATPLQYVRIVGYSKTGVAKGRYSIVFGGPFVSDDRQVAVLAGTVDGYCFFYRISNALMWNYTGVLGTTDTDFDVIKLDDCGGSDTNPTDYPIVDSPPTGDIPTGCGSGGGTGGGDSGGDWGAGTVDPPPDVGPVYGTGSPPGGNTDFPFVDDPCDTQPDTPLCNGTGDYASRGALGISSRDRIDSPSTADLETSHLIVFLDEWRDPNLLALVGRLQRQDRRGVKFAREVIYLPKNASAYSWMLAVRSLRADQSREHGAPAKHRVTAIYRNGHRMRYSSGGGKAESLPSWRHNGNYNIEPQGWTELEAAFAGYQEQVAEPAATNITGRAREGSSPRLGHFHVVSAQR